MKFGVNTRFQPFLDHHNAEEGVTDYQEYTDPIIGQVQEVTDTSLGIRQGPKMYKMLGTKAGVLNGNNRIYPRPVLKSMVQRWKNSNPDGAIGEEGHPPSYVKADGSLGWRSKTENKCIKVVDVHEPDEDGNIYFVFHTIDTQRGRDLQAVLDAGGKIGCSMRAAGKGRGAKFQGRDVQVATHLDLTVFDVLDDPALSDTLGTAVPITDSQIDGLLATEHRTKEFSDAVDPHIERVKVAEKLSDLTRLKNEVEQVELDAIDRTAFDSAWYKRWWQLRELIEAEEMDKRAKRIGFVDNQTEPHEEGIDLKYTFEQLMKMTDSELNRIRQEEPDATAMCDAIIGQRQNEANAEKLKQIENDNNARRAREEAQTFVNSQEVKTMLSRLPANAQKAVLDRVDLTNKETAERTFTDAFEFATQFSADEKLRNLGFDRNKPFTDNFKATANLEVGDTAHPWREFTDKLDRAILDIRRERGEVVLDNLNKVNKPKIDLFMAEFDKRHAAALNNFTDSQATTTETLINTAALHRQIIEQSFHNNLALNFVNLTSFDGQYLTIPYENYTRVDDLSEETDEFGAISAAILELSHAQVSASTNKLTGRISIEAQTFLKSGPLGYNAAARLLYHLSGDLRRQTSVKLWNEMLLQSDELSALKYTNKAVDIDASRTRITFPRPTPYHPILRPRVKRNLIGNAQTKEVVNRTVVYLAGVPVDLAGALIDYENGTVILQNPLADGPVTADYAVVTNIALFDLKVPNGMKQKEHMDAALYLIGSRRAHLAEDRFHPPTFMAMSESLENELSEAEKFRASQSVNGTTLQPEGFVGEVKNTPAFMHNEPWFGGKTRLLMGQRNATVYGVETAITTKGPYPTRDTNGKLNGGDEYLLFNNDARYTPQPEKFTTIRFYDSSAGTV